MQTTELQKEDKNMERTYEQIKKELVETSEKFVEACKKDSKYHSIYTERVARNLGKKYKKLQNEFIQYTTEHPECAV